MDKTVPPSAAIILDFIGGIEAPGGYNVIFGNRQSALDKPLTEMTLAEVQKHQRTWSSAKWAALFKSKKASSAAGRYQFMKTTLAGLIKELGLRTTQKLDADLQDRLAYHLLRRRGFDLWLEGKIDTVEFAKRLAMEWASLPVLRATQGAHRQLKAGQSYYEGDSLNKSLTKPSQVIKVLDAAMAAANDADHVVIPGGNATTSKPVEQGEVLVPSPAPVDVPPVAPRRPGWLRIGILVALAIGMGLLVWFGQGGAEPTVEEALTTSTGARRLFGPEGNSLAVEIGWAIAMSFINPMIAALVTGVVAWIIDMWRQWFKVDFDQKSAEQLHAALERGVLAILAKLGPNASKAKVLAGAAEYAQTFNGGAVKRFGLTTEGLMQLAEPHLAAVKLRR